jgi:amicoumacin kinase
MIPAIKEQFNDEILESAASRFGVSLENLKFMGGFEALVYEYTKNNEDYVIKITHTLRRSIEYIKGEIDWLNYLYDNGMKVCGAIPSENGLLVEAIPAANGNFLVTSYRKALGHEVDAKDWNEHLFEKWGAFLGKTHRLTQSYQLTNLQTKRQEWYEEEQLKASKYLLPNDVAISFIEDKIEDLKKIPNRRDNYGLVHADFHQKNFFLDRDHNIVLFDFDDISYTYFINDIAITLYYALLNPFKELDDKVEYYRTFFKHFMTGYLKENTLHEEEIRFLDDFIKLRHALLFVIFHQAYNVEELDSEGLALLNNHRQEFMAEEPIIPIDFYAIFQSLIAKK